MTQKPDLSFWKLWNLSFGFFGVQIAYALQSANISRIFATLGADPHDLSYFWILPPLMGILVQPIVGSLSDKTWCRFGRRIPYLFIGATLAVLVMCLITEKALNRVGFCLLFFIDHVAHKHLKRLHRHVDTGIKKHQCDEAEQHSTAYG